MRDSHRILQESTGNRWNMEAVFRPESFRFFFRWIPARFLCFPAGILLPQNYRNYPEPAVSRPDSSTWEKQN
jgi:hypothetical protein